jgi:hypothetical protein
MVSCESFREGNECQKDASLAAFGREEDPEGLAGAVRNHLMDLTAPENNLQIGRLGGAEIKVVSPFFNLAPRARAKTGVLVFFVSRETFELAGARVVLV